MADNIYKTNLLAHCLKVLDSDPSVVFVYAKVGLIDGIGKLLSNIANPGWSLQCEAAYERLRYVIYAGQLVNPYYGLVRATALLKA
jgi:hypothetical protein